METHLSGRCRQLRGSNRSLGSNDNPIRLRGAGGDPTVCKGTRATEPVFCHRDREPLGLWTTPDNEIAMAQFSLEVRLQAL